MGKSLIHSNVTSLLPTKVALQEIHLLLEKEFDEDYAKKQSVCHGLRAWFESNLKKDSSCFNPLFWRLYMYSEFKQNQKIYLKSIFFRAIQHCPWSKMIYMDGIHYIPEILDEIHDIMIEKELRVYVPLEEAELYVS